MKTTFFVSIIIATCILTGCQSLFKQNSVKIEKSSVALATQDFPELNLRVSYPSTWKTPTLLFSERGLSAGLYFPDFIDERYEIGKYSGEMKIKNNFPFHISITNYDTILKNYSKSLLYGGEAVNLNLDYLPYFENKFTNFSPECSETDIGVGKCLKLNKIRWAQQEYLSYFTLVCFGDWSFSKDWMRFFDDKILTVSFGILDSDITSWQDEPWKNGCSGAREIGYEDLKFNEQMLKTVSQQIETIMSQIQFESIHPVPQVSNRYQNIEKEVEPFDQL